MTDFAARCPHGPEELEAGWIEGVSVVRSDSSEKLGGVG